MTFIKAQKGKKPVRVVFSGASGSGKSFTALKFAQYLSERSGNPTAAVDTEHGRLSLYADKFSFDVDEFEPPFHPNRLIELIHDAEKAGYGQLVVDSSTHFYAGTGGLLEIVQVAAKTKFGNNQYYAWAEGNPIHTKLIDTIIRSPMHIIVTARAKQTYIEQEKGGRKVYEKQGYDMIQKEGLDYELDFAFMMDMDNGALVNKGMGLITPGMYFPKPGEEMFSAVMESIEKNSTEFSAPILRIGEVIKETKSLLKENGGSANEELMKIVHQFSKTGKIDNLTIEELNSLKSAIQNMKKEN